MKIFIINTVGLEENGISTFILNTCKELIKHNYDITIGAPNHVSGEIQKQVNDLGITLIGHLNRNQEPIRYFFKIYRLCRQNQYDVVHVNGNSTTMAIELAAAKLAGVKVRVAHSHNTTTRHVKANQLLRPFFEMVVNGRIACNQAAGKWLFKSKDFVIIENGIDFDKYKLNQNVRTKIRSKLGISDDKILIGHIGKFNSQKNQEFLIELAEKLDDRYRVILIGNGVNLKKDRLLVEKKGLLKKVLFTGAVRDVIDYLNAMDIFALPSFYEGQPFSLIEAQAAGLPCFVSDKVSQETNVTKNVTYLPIDDVTAWKNEIEFFSFSDNRIDRRDQNVKYLLRNGFSSEDNANKLIKSYDDFKVNRR